MQYRKYGKLGFDVSLLGMGCMRLPRIDHPDGSVTVDREAAYEIIRYAADNGINYFDTAFSYHNGDSEAVLGEALEGERRKRVKVVTKQPLFVMHTQADIRKNLEATLKKLRTDFIDIYLIHCITPETWGKIQERDIIGEFEKFKQEGLIGAIGFSYHGTFPTFKEVVSAYPWAMVQIQQNLLDTDKEATEEGIRVVGEKGCALVIMEPLMGGGLAQAPRRVQEIYDAHPVKRSPIDWAFRHLIDYPQVSTILSGMSSLEQLKENIALFSAPDALPGCLSAADRYMLGRVKAAYESVVTIPCTGCEYCLPCPQGVAIPEVFSEYNAGMKFENFDNARRNYMLFDRRNAKASKCVGCGACEPKCPQNIPIIEQLKMAHAALDGWKE